MIHDLPGEVWKDIPGYEDSYSASNMGRIKSKSRYNYKGSLIKTKILKKSLSHDVKLYSDNKSKSYIVSRLIFETFIGQIDENHTVIHIDGDSFNDRIYNLKAISRLDFNRLFHLQPVIQLDLNDNIIDEFDGIIDVVRKFGFKKSCISEVCLRKRKTAYGFKWRYKDDI